MVEIAAFNQTETYAFLIACENTTFLCQWISFVYSADMEIGILHMTFSMFSVVPILIRTIFDENFLYSP